MKRLRNNILLITGAGWHFSRFGEFTLEESALPRLAEYAVADKSQLAGPAGSRGFSAYGLHTGET